MKIIFKGKPIPKARPRVVKGHTYNPQSKQLESAYWDAYAQVREEWSKLYGNARFMFSPIGLGIHLRITFFMPVPASWSNKKKKQHYGTHHVSKPDIDNLSKFYLDALHNSLYADDKQVHTLEAEKRYIEEGEEPRTVVEVI